MMTPLGMVRSMGKIVRGGASPAQIFLACILGVMIGITPGCNLTLMIGIALVVLLNANLALTLLGVAIGKALMYALAPLTFAIGRVLIEDVAGGLFTAMADTPVLALMGFDSYCLVGGLVIGVVVGAIFGLTLAKTVVTIRRGVLAGRDRSDKLDKAAHNIFVRIILRLLFGKQKKTLAEIMETKPTLLRKSGCIIIIVLAVLIVGGQLLMANVLFKGMVHDGLAGANGAQVDLEDASLSILGGSLEMRGLAVTDRDKPTHNVVQLTSLVGDLSITDLLAKRVVVETLSIDNPRLDAKREKAGDVFKSDSGDKSGAQADSKSAGDEGQEDEATKQAKQKEQFDALAAELEHRIRKELDKLADDQVNAKIDKAAENVPSLLRETARKKIDVEVKQRIRKWTADTAKKIAQQLIEQLKKQDKFADYASEAMKYRKYTVYIDRARKKLAERKAAKDRGKNSAEYKKQLADRAAAEGYLALRADLVKQPPWSIRRLKMDNFTLGKAGKYNMAARNISGRPELSDTPMKVLVTRTDGALPAELVFGFADGDYYGPDLTVSFSLSLGEVGGLAWASDLTFEGKLTGGLNATPKLDVNTDKALADLRAKATANIEAEITRQVNKAAKDAIGVETPDILKTPAVKNLLKKKDIKKIKPKDLLKGILGG